MRKDNRPASPHPDDPADEIAAFANADGGVLLWRCIAPGTRTGKTSACTTPETGTVVRSTSWSRGTDSHGAGRTAYLGPLPVDAPGRRGRHPRRKARMSWCSR